MNSEFSISNSSWYKFLTEFPKLLLLQGISIECKLKHCDRTSVILYLVLKTKMKTSWTTQDHSWCCRTKKTKTQTKQPQQKSETYQFCTTSLCILEQALQKTKKLAFTFSLPLWHSCWCKSLLACYYRVSNSRMQSYIWGQRGLITTI